MSKIKTSAATLAALSATKKIPLIATPEEVKELQAIRDLRLANKSYEAKKTKFFAKFRAKYSIPDTAARIKIETENEKCLGKTQYVGNNMVVKASQPLAAGA